MITLRAYATILMRRLEPSSLNAYLLMRPTGTPRPSGPIQQP